MLTQAQERILRDNGWQTRNFGYWYSCRICHRNCGHHNVWVSPNYAFYHEVCVEKSAQVKKLLKGDKQCR